MCMRPLAKSRGYQLLSAQCKSTHFQAPQSTQQVNVLPRVYFLASQSTQQVIVLPRVSFHAPQAMQQVSGFTGMAAEATAAPLCRHGASDGKLYAILIYSLTRPCFWHVMPSYTPRRVYNGHAGCVRRPCRGHVRPCIHACCTTTGYTKHKWSPKIRDAVKHTQPAFLPYSHSRSTRSSHQQSAAAAMQVQCLAARCSDGLTAAADPLAKLPPQRS
jgi:hypothetical protein